MLTSGHYCWAIWVEVRPVRDLHDGVGICLLQNILTDPEGSQPTAEYSLTKAVFFLTDNNVKYFQQ